MCLTISVYECVLTKTKHVTQQIKTIPEGKLNKTIAQIMNYASLFGQPQTREQKQN